MLLLGTVVATDAGEEGEPLHREGEHFLSTCTDGERCRGEHSSSHVAGGRWRGSDGGRAQPTEAMGGGRHLRCVGTRAGAGKRGARGGGLRRTCASARSCAC